MTVFIQPVNPEWLLHVFHLEEKEAGTGGGRPEGERGRGWGRGRKKPQRPSGLQSQKYLLFGPLEKKFADIYSKMLNMFSSFNQ